MSVIPAEEYSYTQEESLEVLIHSIRGNKICKDVRKGFNLCRSTVLGKFVEPEICKDEAFKFINCFQRVRRDETAQCKQSYTQVLECSKNNANNWFNMTSPCNSDLEQYLNC